MTTRTFLLFSILACCICQTVPSHAEPESAPAASGAPAPSVPAKRRLLLQAPPAASVSSVAVSPDGSLVAAASGEGAIRFLNAATGELVRNVGDTDASCGDRSAVFSPDGKTVAAAGFHMDKLVKLVDVSSGKILRTFPGHSQIETYAVAFSPDGKLLASACRDHEILVWEVATARLLHRLEGAPAVALAFSPDSKTLATGGADRTVHLWDIATGHEIQSLAGHSDCVVTLAFLPDGKSLASGSCDWANHRARNTANFSWHDPGCTSQWKVWDLATGKVQAGATAPGRLLSLAVAPDGKSLACAIGKEVVLYDPQKQSAAPRVLTTRVFDATSVAFTPHGRGVITGSHDQTVKLIDLATGKVDWQSDGYLEQVNSVALSADGSLLATGSSDARFAIRTLQATDAALAPGAARLWDSHTGRLLRHLGDQPDQIMAVAISPDVKHVAAAGADRRAKGVVHLFDAQTGSPLWSTDDHKAEVLAIAFAPDGSFLATASADGTVNLRDPRTGTVVRSFPGHEGGATSVAFVANGASLVCGQGQGGVRIWDVATGRLVHLCKSPSSAAATITNDRLLTTVAFAPDNRTVLECIASVGNTYSEPARFWDAQTGNLVREVKGARPVALSPDGSLLAAGGKSVSLRSAETGDEARRLTGRLKKVQSIVFSPDGRLLYAGGSYGTVNVWEVVTGRHLAVLFAFPTDRKDAAPDDWLAYHPNGCYDGSPGIEKYLAWRVGEEMQTPQTIGLDLHNPGVIRASLNLERP